MLLSIYLYPRISQNSSASIFMKITQFKIINCNTRLSTFTFSSGNGMISEQEFFKWMSKMQTRTGSEEDDIEEDLKAAFHVFDREHCGFITKEDLKQAMQLIGENMTDKDLDELLRTSDLDKDGKINYEDFIKILH